MPRKKLHRFDEIRQEFGLSQRLLGIAAKVARTMISANERGLKRSFNLTKVNVILGLAHAGNQQAPDMTWKEPLINQHLGRFKTREILKCRKQYYKCKADLDEMKRTQISSGRILSNIAFLNNSGQSIPRSLKSVLEYSELRHRLKYAASLPIKQQLIELKMGALVRQLAALGSTVEIP